MFVGTIETLVDLVADPTEARIETRDPNDAYLIALARANQVELIVSGDKDLLEWKAQRPRVVTSSEVWHHQSTGAAGNFSFGVSLPAKAPVVLTFSDTVNSSTSSGGRVDQCGVEVRFR